MESELRSIDVDELLGDMVGAGFLDSARMGKAARDAAEEALEGLAEHGVVTRQSLGDGVSFCYATSLTRSELARAVNEA